MNKPKFAPWPWRVKRYRPDPFDYVMRPYATIEDADGRELAVLNVKHSSPKDRRIMAAAPKMYALLHELMLQLYQIGCESMARQIETLLDEIRGKGSHKKVTHPGRDFL